jgi:hypothetical protein
MSVQFQQHSQYSTDMARRWRSDNNDVLKGAMDDCRAEGQESIMQEPGSTRAMVPRQVATPPSDDCAPSTDFQNLVMTKFTQMDTRIAALETRNKIKDKQVDSLVHMNCLDHLIGLICCNRNMSEIRDRTLKDDEKEIIRK